jgi:hypothetical protein
LSLCLSQHHGMKTYWEWRWVVSFTHLPLCPQGKSPWYTLDRRLGGPQSRSGYSGVEERNFQPSPGLETRSSDRPTHSQSLYRLSYPCSSVLIYTLFIVLLLLLTSHQLQSVINCANASFYWTFPNFVRKYSLIVSRAPLSVGSEAIDGFS